MVKFCARISDKVVTRETGPVAMEAHGLFTKDEESGGYSLEEAGRALAAQLKADTPGLVAALEKATRDAVAAASKPPKAASVPASVASSSSTKPTPKVAASKPASGAVAGKAALTVAKNAADIVLEAREVGVEVRAQELLATRESVVTEARRKRRFELWEELSREIAEDDDAAQAACMKAVRKRADEELPHDKDTTELRAAFEGVKAARAELIAREGALATIVGRLDGAPPASKRRKK